MSRRMLPRYENLQISGGGRVLDFDDTNITGFNGNWHGRGNQRWIMEYVASRQRPDPWQPGTWTMRSHTQGRRLVAFQGNLVAGVSLVLNNQATPVVFGVFSHPQDPTSAVLRAQGSQLVVDLAGGRAISSQAFQVTLARFNPASVTQRLRINTWGTRGPSVRGLSGEDTGDGEDIGVGEIESIDITEEYLNGAPVYDPEADVQAPEEDA